MCQVPTGSATSCLTTSALLIVQADFRSGRVEEFLQDQSISAADMRSAPIAYCVAEAMACFHFSPLILSSDGVPPRPIVWDRLRSWAGSVASHYGSKELQTLGIPNMLDEVHDCPLCKQCLVGIYDSHHCIHRTISNDYLNNIA